MYQSQDTGIEYESSEPKTSVENNPLSHWKALLGYGDGPLIK